MYEIFICMIIKVKKYKKLSELTFKFVNIERKLQVVRSGFFSPLKQTRITSRAEGVKSSSFTGELDDMVILN